MKSGISLVEMAKEIQRQAELKADYMMDTRSLRLEPFGSDLYLNAYIRFPFHSLLSVAL